MTKFEGAALAAVVMMVGGLGAAAHTWPLPWETFAPRAFDDRGPPPQAQRVDGRPWLPSPGRVRVSVGTLTESFRKLGYDLDSVREGESPVPRLFLARLPHDLATVPEVADRKAVFFQAVLPLVLQANEEILADRRRLWRLRFKQRMGEPIAAVDRLWLATMAERYRVPRGDLDALLRRVDGVPPSLALAQAAIESGWGTSRFTREGNALFGQWTFIRPGMTPEARDEGKTHRVRAFGTLRDSIRAYRYNLNTHRAYREFRAIRADLRRRGRPLDGATLAGTLERYSEEGPEYLEKLRLLMEKNRLAVFDGARLHQSGPESGQMAQALPRQSFPRSPTAGPVRRTAGPATATGRSRPEGYS